jgi:hypothetical protein
MKPDELTGCYTAEMDPKAGPKVLTPAQAAFQRAAGKATASFPKVEPERQPTPLTSPVNSDDEGMSADQRRCVNRGKKMANRGSKKSTEPTVQAPAKGAPLEIKKAAAPPRAPADQPTGAKAPRPTKGQAKGQDSPETKVSPPMQTRGQVKKQASGAGALRGVAGSGQIGAVRGSSSPARKPGS